MRDYYGNRIPEPRLDPPEPDDYPEHPPQCSNRHCRGFLSLTKNHGTRVVRDSAGVLIGIEYVTCAKCGRENVENSYPLEHPDIGE
jgi:hypothetical protein